MFNPILYEIIAREQHRDRLNQAEQRRLAEADMAHQPARRFEPRISPTKL